MKVKKIQKYQMVTRVDDFSSKNVTTFPAKTAAGEVVTAIRTLRVRLSQLLSRRVSIDATVRACGNALQAARNSVRIQMDAMIKTAHALEIGNFQLPKTT